MSLVAGIDYSTNAIDVVLINEDTGDASHYRRPLDTGPGDAVTRIRRIRNVMPARGHWNDQVISIGIEEPFSRGAGGAYLMQLALGAILSCLPATIDLHLLRADDWRRICGIPTRASREIHKQRSCDFAAQHWAEHPTPMDDNAAEAFCIAYATHELLHNRSAARRAA